MSKMPSGADFEAARARATELATDFHAHQNEYLGLGYTEAQVRQDFLDKLLTALGWDVAHNVQKDPYQQEVRVERHVGDGPALRRADYAFFVAPNFRDVRFYVEAKKPRGDIATRDNYFQAIRYGWNSQTPLAIITNFEQFHILDCRYKPDIDTALERVVRKYHYSDYLNEAKFAEIFYLFGRSAVAAGAIDRFAEGLPKKRGKAVQRGFFKGGYQRIDDAFLEELDAHRDSLARSIKLCNPKLGSLDLTEMTQRIIDRLVFIRFLEDKLIEPQYLVANFGDKGSVWGDFIAASRRLDHTYNGIVFKKHPILDTHEQVVDDAVFGEICEALSHINSPYDFNAIPIHILGSIYERFLGKVIVATEKRARLVPKREVRKAGGVFYTPTYIVSHVVDQTMAKSIEGKSPAQMAEMRFLDLACGSGSFLLGVYDLLLRYHRDWYVANPSKAKKGETVEHTNGSIGLSLSKKREILVNNIFGVDIDPQAVEVAQLSLYLKLLEEESTATARTYQLEFETTLLPPLSGNVVCGNALIETDLLDGELLPSDVERDLRPMDIRTRFKKVFDSGGFDVVVGNPPYVRPHNVSKREKEYFWTHYRTFTHKSDLYCCFIERCTGLLKPHGMLGYIVSRGWLRLNSFQELRRHLLDNYRVLQLVELPQKVFADAQVETAIVILEKEQEREASRDRTKVEVLQGSVSEAGATFVPVRRIPQKAFTQTFQQVFDLSISPETDAVKTKMRTGLRIGDVFSVVFGLKTGDDAKFVHKEKGRHAEDRELLRGDDVKRYGYEWKGEYVWYVPKRMRAHRSTSRPGEPERFEQPKVLVKDTSKNFACAYDDQHYYVKDVLILIPRGDVVKKPDLRFVAGVINSKALRFYYRTTFDTLHVQNEELASLPLPPIDLELAGDRERHNRLVKLVDQMIEARRNAARATSHAQRDYSENRMRELDEKIDAAVFALYGLDDDDVRVVDAASA